MFLLDTNIWLERLLGQEQSQTVETLLETVALDRMCMTDFSLHSIGVICSRLGQTRVFTQFVQDVVVEGGIWVVSLPPEALLRLEPTMKELRLDFDDAYQYLAAEWEQATIVSFDRDFDKTPRGRLTPAQLLAR